MVEIEGIVERDLHLVVGGFLPTRIRDFDRASVRPAGVIPVLWSIAGIADAIAVGVLLAGVGNVRTVVAHIADLIAVGVRLSAVSSVWTIVTRIPHAIRVVINGETVGSLQKIEDIGAIAEETFRAKKSLIYLRSAARAVAKGLAAHKLKKKLDTGRLAGWLKKAAVDASMDITENADLRCSHLLPGQIHVGDIEIEPGSYDITVEFLGADGAVIGNNHFTDFPVAKGAFNLAEAVLLR